LFMERHTLRLSIGAVVCSVGILMVLAAPAPARTPTVPAGRPLGVRGAQGARNAARFGDRTLPCGLPTRHDGRRRILLRGGAH
jgi:hypothetical protein